MVRIVKEQALTQLNENRISVEVGELRALCVRSRTDREQTCGYKELCCCVGAGLLAMRS
jgi:hypothetical protein